MVSKIRKWISVSPNATRTQENITWDSSDTDSESEFEPSFLENKCKTSYSTSSSLSPHASSHTSSNCLESSTLSIYNRLDASELSPEFKLRSQLGGISPVILRRVNPYPLSRVAIKCIETESSPSKTANGSQQIEPFPTQLATTVEYESFHSSLDSLYYQPPKRRKHYKKGGLAYRVQKLLKAKESRIKIWHHERLCNKGGCQTGGDALKVELVRKWVEYGVNLLECKDMGENRTIVANIGTSLMVNVQLIVGALYEIHMPYVVDNIVYKGQCVPYYHNVSKIFRVETV